MRQAPPVGVTCSGRGSWRGVQVLLAALAAAVLASWLLLLAGGPVSAALAAAGAGALLGWRASRPQPALLQWDGQAWQADGTAGELGVMLDLGAWMLLRWRGGGAVRWLPVSRADAGPSWPALRAALLAPAAPTP